MTAAIVGIFLLVHFEASWPWYVGVIGYAGLEAYHTDRFRKLVLHQLGEIRISLWKPSPPDED